MSLAPKFISDEDMPYGEESTVIRKASSLPDMSTGNNSNIVG